MLITGEYRVIPQEEVDAMREERLREIAEDRRRMAQADARRERREAEEAGRRELERRQLQFERRYGTLPTDANRKGSGLPIAGKLPRRVIVDVWYWWCELPPSPAREQSRLIPDMAAMFGCSNRDMVRALIALKWRPWRKAPPRGLEYEMWQPPHDVGHPPWDVLGEEAPPMTPREQHVFDMMLADETGMVFYPRLVPD